MSSNKITIPIRGMHCASCEILIGDSIKKITGVRKVQVNHKTGQAVVHYDGAEPANKALKRAVQEAGYEIGQKEKLPWISTAWADYKDLIKAAVILLVLYSVGKRFGLFDLSVDGSNTGLMVALLVGLVAGVSTCMALIGGLVLSLSARHAELHPEATAMQKFRPHFWFNVGRIAGYAFLGGIIGLIGKAVEPSVGVLGFLTMLVGGVMIFFGLKLIEIFPVLKDKSITLPASLARLLGLKSEVKEYSRKSSMVMGALTFFLPCGFTQAMQIYAVSTASFWQGAAVMGLFALGTAPGLLGIGGLTSVFRGRRARVFFMTAGLAVIILGWFNITNGGRLLSSGSNSAKAAADAPTGRVQEVRMTQSGNGYSPNILTVESGRPVKWIINSTSQFTCAASIVVPKFGISRSLQVGENIITFTPTEAGEIPFSCSMGMFRGKFVVVDKDGGNRGAIPPSPAAAVGGAPSCGGGAKTQASCGSGGGCGGCGAGRPFPDKRTYKAASEPGITDSYGNQVIRGTFTLNEDIVPSNFTVKKGQPVRFEIDVKEDGEGCMSTMLIPGLYDVVEMLQAGNDIVMNFTAYATGEYPITCAMGVPRGVIKVID